MWVTPPQRGATIWKDRLKMNDIKPNNKPVCINFSSGPCTKRPGWSVNSLDGALLGRSHRSKLGKEKLQKSIDQTIEILKIPEGYKVGIVAGSDTGAIEMAMWNLLGSKPVEILAWEVFGNDWKKDILEQLKINDSNTHVADFGDIPDLSKINFDNDVIFTWNGTTSGVKVPNADWIPLDRKGLVLCDATSAVFAQDVEWKKLDVVTFSWQKVLGGEAAHGIIVLSPKAIEHLESYTPKWPIPKIFRLTKSNKVIEGIFKGETLNTPSMLCVEDYLDALSWVKGIGGLNACFSRANDSFNLINDWVDRSDAIDFLCQEKINRSNTSVCLKFCDDRVVSQNDETQRALAKEIGVLLEKEGVAYDIVNHRSAPPGLRIWTGATVESTDVKALLPWIDWAYNQAFNKILN